MQFLQFRPVYGKQTGQKFVSIDAMYSNIFKNVNILGRTERDLRFSKISQRKRRTQLHNKVYGTR